MILCPESPELTSDLLKSQQNPIILRYQSSLVPAHQTGLHRLLIVHGECALCRQQLPDPAVTHGLSLRRKEGTTVLGKHSPLQPLGRRGAASDQSYNLLLLFAVTTLILPENVSSGLG